MNKTIQASREPQNDWDETVSKETSFKVHWMVYRTFTTPKRSYNTNINRNWHYKIKTFEINCKINFFKMKYYDICLMADIKNIWSILSEIIYLNVSRNILFH